MLIDFDHGVVETERPIREQGIYKRDVSVGHNVWIGYGACLLRGVTVGDNAIIGTSSVITADVPAERGRRRRARPAAADARRAAHVPLGVAGRASARPSRRAPAPGAAAPARSGSPASARSSAAAWPSARSRGISPGQRPGDEERPVAALQREQLAQRPRRAGAAGPRRPQLERPRAPRELGHRRAAPGPQVAALAPASSPAAPRGAGAGSAPLERVVERRQRQALRRPPPRSPPPATATPSYHQWPSSSVSSATTHVPPPATRSPDPSPRSRPRPPGPAPSARPVVVGRPVVGVDVVAVLGVVVVVAVGARVRVAALVPHERHRRPVDRPQHRPGRGAQRPEVARVAEAEHPRQLHARRPHPGRLEQRVEPRGVAALGQPQPAAPGAAAPAVRRDPGLQLQPHAPVGGQQRQHRVRRASRSSSA